MAPHCPEIHRDKQKSLDIPVAPLPHGFLSDVKFTWFTRFFRTRKIMVERALDNTWSLSITPFFLIRLHVYALWIPVLTACKAVNPGWVRAVCASLVKVLDGSTTYRACVRGHNLTISSATIAVALGVTIEVDYEYPLRSDHFFRCHSS